MFKSALHINPDLLLVILGAVDLLDIELILTKITHRDCEGIK